MKQTNKVIITIISFISSLCFIGPVLAGDVNGNMSYGGKNRTYLLHVPSGYNAATPTPLLFVFHGLTGTGSMMSDITQFSPLSDQENFLVVYPDGIGKKWASPGGNIDDVGFISALIDALSSTYNVDADRVFAAGASNGGMFTYRLGMELTERFAGIASIAGFLPNYSQAPVPSKNIPVLHFHGTADGIIPLSAGENAVDYWVDFNNCNLTPSTVTLPNADPGDGTTVDELTYANGTGNSEVKLYKVYGGGHTWPGTPSNAMPGKVTKDISASEIIWDYFKNINQASNTAPAVSFTKPVTGAEFIAPAIIQLKATAVDADGTIKHVKFYNGSSVLKTDQTSAYNYTWNNVPAGVYTIIAEASDDQNATSYDTTTITVNPAKVATDQASSLLLETSFDPYNQQFAVCKVNELEEYDLFLFDAMGRSVFTEQHIRASCKTISTVMMQGGLYLYVLKMTKSPAISGKFTVAH